MRPCSREREGSCGCPIAPEGFESVQRRAPHPLLKIDRPRGPGDFEMVRRRPCRSEHQVGEQVIKLRDQFSEDLLAWVVDWEIAFDRHSTHGKRDEAKRATATAAGGLEVADEP
jgi:hypothetical protein